MIIGHFRVGEDISVALDAVAGDVADVVEITASMRRSSNASRFVPHHASDAVSMTVAARAAAGDIPAGWNITLPAAQSAALREGVYGIDARLQFVGGGVDLTEAPALIRLTRAA